ncbi:MAG: SpaA isopeptide-forming pilin-related protein [Vagococcus sp.]
MEYDVYITVNGKEELLVSNPKYDKPYQEKTLVSFGYPKGTHVSQVRYELKNPPAGLYSKETIRHIFTIKEGYTGQVKNTSLYDVVGYNSKNDKIHWSNSKEILNNDKPGEYDVTDNPGEYSDITTPTGDRTANVIDKPSAAVPIAQTGIKFLTSNQGVVVSGKNRIEGFFKNNQSSPTTINKQLESYALLPVDVVVDSNNPEYQLVNTLGVADEKTENGNNSNGVFTVVTDNYQGTGRQLVKISWNEDKINPGKGLTYRFNVTIKGTAPVPIIMDTYGYSGDKTISVPQNPSSITDSYLQKNLDNMDNSNDLDKNRVQSGNQYKMVKENKVKTQKLVKGENDTDYSKFGYTNLGGDISYRLEMTNFGDKIGHFVMMDVLPSVGDLGISDNVSRDSQFTPILTGPVVLSNLDSSKVSIKYSKSKNPSRKDLVKDVVYPTTTEPLEDPINAENPNWLSEDQVTDWTGIHSFMISMNKGEWESGETALLEFNMKAPDTLDASLTDYKLDDTSRAAWNSFAYTSNNSQVVEPERVGIVVNQFEAELIKVDDKTGDVLSGAVFELQDSEGNVLESGLTTDESGKLSIDNLAPGKYQLVETKAPTGYELDATPIEFSIKAKDDQNKQEHVKVKKVNKIKESLIILEKKDSKSKKLLSGAEFELRDEKGKVIRETIKVEKDGTTVIADVPFGSYQLIETKAPDGYRIDGKPFVFTVKQNKETIRLSIYNDKLPTNPIKPNKPNKPNKLIKLPQTGEEVKKGLGLLGVFLILIVSVLVFKRKKDSN